jgi:GTP cyclohydrolase IA
LSEGGLNTKTRRNEGPRRDFAGRLQNQERTAHLIAAFVEQVVEPLGAAVLIDGEHLCAIGRGVRDTHWVMRVNVMHGAFQMDSALRQEFLMRVGRR